MIIMSTYALQGGVIIRAARRMADRVGFDPETGLLTAETPKVQEDVNLLDDSECFIICSLLVTGE